MEYSEWIKEYDKWKEKALAEFKDSEFWEEDYGTGTLEVTEDGHIYLGGFHYVKNVVTPWKDSEYFIE